MSDPSRYRANQEPDEDGYPDHLSARFDWMTVPHPQLFHMVRHGINVEDAHAQAGDWKTVSDELAALSEELTEALREVTDGWEGPAAQRAEENITALSAWARRSANKADEVSECITFQADLADQARAVMPPPADEPTHGASPMPHGANLAQVPPAGATFTGGGFGGATNVLADQQVIADAARDKHAQAARVMDQFQSASREVHQTVPRFAEPDPPMSRGRQNVKHHNGSQPHSVRTGEAEHLDRTETAAAAGPSAGALPVGGGGLGGALGGLGSGPVAEGTSGPLGMPRFGARAGAGEPPAVARPGVAPAGAGGVGGGPMPMGMGPGGRGEDHEYRQASYLDDDLWSDLHSSLRPSIPVIGADHA